MPFLVLFLALIAPLALWPIEIFFPYPHLVEELVKALLIFFLLRYEGLRQKIFGAFLIGFLFGITENILYLFSPVSSQIHLLRFYLTMPLHILTTFAILIPALVNKKLFFLGIIIAIFIHYFFNIYVAHLLP